MELMKEEDEAYVISATACVGAEESAKVALTKSPATVGSRSLPYVYTQRGRSPLTTLYGALHRFTEDITLGRPREMEKPKLRTA